MKRFLIAGGLLISSIVCPIVASAQIDDHPYNSRYYENRRYYDRAGRDYHAWNLQEHRAYRYYLQDQHREYREWRTVPRYDRSVYFQWRHTHPDSVIVVR